MISANDARRKSLLNAEAKMYIEQLEKEIEDATNRGEYSAKINHEMYARYSGNDTIKKALFETLENLGYSVNFTYAKERPAGWPDGQWVYKNGILEVSWEVS